MLVSPAEIETLARRLEPNGGGLRFAAVECDVDPLTFVRAGSRLFRTAHYFSTPDGETWAGLGEAWSASRAGERRFADLDTALTNAPSIPAPFRFFLGFSFAADGPRTDVWKGYGAVDVLLPQISVGTVGDTCHLLLAVPPGADSAALLDTLGRLVDPGAPHVVDPGAHTVVGYPSPTDWRTAVGDAVSAIAEGPLEKVVLGRSVVVTAETPPAPFDLAAHLQHAYAQCYTFAWQVGDATFVGASPELLMRKDGPQIKLNPLAGSAARGEGEDEDRRLAEELMGSTKDRHEHALVVDDIVTRLGPLTSGVRVPSHPSLRRMATVQHLSTEITAELATDHSPLALLDLLHPTPAVGGTPRVEAAEFIERIEGLDRGWYSGGVGWVTPDGDCELTLSIRCGLLRGDSAWLYAGAGIVGDSDPDAELVETRLKFRPLLELLAAT